jgi:hypothetical protein
MIDIISNKNIINSKFKTFLKDFVDVASKYFRLSFTKSLLDTSHEYETEDIDTFAQHWTGQVNLNGDSVFYNRAMISVYYDVIPFYDDYKIVCGMKLYYSMDDRSLELCEDYIDDQLKFEAVLNNFIETMYSYFELKDDELEDLTRLKKLHNSL